MVLGLILLLQSIVVAVSGPPTSPEYLPIRVAEAFGLFAREGVHVTLRTTRAEPGAAEALAQAQADLAATSFEALVRFGHRMPAPRIVFALTVAPPVTLLVAEARGEEIRSVKSLAGGKVAFSAPGTPEQTWLQALLARQAVTPTAVELVALGTRGVVSALDSGDVTAAFVTEPAASALVRDGRARVLIDLKSARAVSDALGGPTVNAAIFARGDRRPNDAALTAFARALLAAERVIASSEPDALKEPLSRAVVGDGEFSRRVEATRGIYVPGGVITPDAVTRTIEAMKTHLPLPRGLKLPRPTDMLHLEPARRAARSKPPS